MWEIELGGFIKEVFKMVDIEDFGVVCGVVKEII